MSEQVRQIATRIRELREITGLSVADVAKDLDMPEEAYQSFESGAVDIPVGALYKIARRFNVELTELITGETPKLHEYCLVRKGKGVSVDRAKQYKYQSLAYNYVHKKAEPFLVTVDPQPENTPVPLRSHPGQEFNYVIKGTLKVVVHKHELILNEGDSLFFDSSFDHGMKALNGKPVEFLAIAF